jgi:hypothetical protein
MSELDRLISEIMTDLTCKAETIGILLHRVELLEKRLAARDAMDVHVMEHMRERHDPRATENEYQCWVCLPYLIPAEILHRLSSDDLHPREW